jgi:predicted nucleic acid-binding protein
VILVDTNVLFDVLTNDAEWADWSQRQLEVHALADRLVINPVIYAELSSRYDRVDDLEAALALMTTEVVEIPHTALFLAGKAYRAYRERRGTKTGVLPDFFIGAHAAVAAVPLITRDTMRYRSYFPTVELIAPSE